MNASYIRPTIDIAALPIADVALWGITAFVTNDPVPVYAGADRGYALVGRAQPGDVLSLNGRNDAATWVHVYLPDGRAGWAAADSSFLPSASLNDLPILTPFLDAPPPNLAPFFLVYTGPGFLYEPIDSVAEGQSLGIVGRTADSRWVLVRLADGREGWIAAEIVQIGEALANVPVTTGIAPPQVVGWQATGGAQATGDASGDTGTTGGKQPTGPATATNPSPSATPTSEPPTATATEAPPSTETPQATPTTRVSPT
ncbi:MAG TPA: SH3 domain-containing protein, partial [Promineifilum sp.]|nr:SH3 domain-containing protein [Promineifilum sp.]